MKRFLFTIINKFFSIVNRVAIAATIGKYEAEYGCKINFHAQGQGGLAIACSEADKHNKFFIHPTSHLKSSTYIECSGGVYIDKYFHTGRGLTILTSNHDYRSTDSVPYGVTDIFKPVKIEGYVWSGIDVTILPGVTIGEGAILGAGTVISKDVPAGAIVVGNPATIVKYRDMEVFTRLKNEGKAI